MHSCACDDGTCWSHQPPYPPYRISEYIPPRPPVPHKEGGVQRAVNDYHQKTGEIASVLLTEFRELFGEEVASGAMSEDQDAVNERCITLCTYSMVC